MVIAASVLTEGGVEHVSTSFATASISPTEEFLLIAISTFEKSTSQPTVSSISGCGLTWTAVNTAPHDASGGDRSTLILWKGVGTPSSGTITVTYTASVDRSAWIVQELSGVDTTSPIVQSKGAVDSGTSINIFFDNPGADPNNATFLATAVQENTNVDQISYSAPYIELAEAYFSYAHVGTAYRPDFDAFTATAAFTNAGKNGIIITEIAQASGSGPQTVTCQLITASSTVLSPTVVGPKVVVLPVLNATSTLFNPSVDDGSKTLPAVISTTAIEPETHSYCPVIIDSNGNLYRILESQLAANNQPRAMKSSDGGETWTEQDAANRPGTDTGSIGDLESGWTTWDSNDKQITFTWQRSYVVWSGFRTSDHATNPDTWVSNTREEVISDEGTPQFASHTSPTDQSYEWIFASTAASGAQYRSRTSSGVYGTLSTVDASGNSPAAILDENNISHIIYTKSSQIHYKKLTSGGTLDGTSTRVDTNGIHTVSVPFTAPQAYFNGVNTYVGVLFLNGSGHLKFVLMTNGTPGSEETITTNVVVTDPGVTGNGGAVCSLAFDSENETFHAVWSEVTSDDVMHSDRPLTGSWDTPAALQTPTFEPAWIYSKVNEYPNGDRVLSYTYTEPNSDDQNTPWYGELALASATPTIVCNLISTPSSVLTPTVVQNIHTNLITTSSTIFQPTVKFDVIVPVIVTTSTLFDPSTKADVVLQTLATVSNLFNLSVFHRFRVEIPVLTAASTLFSPTVNQDLVLNVINTTAVVQNPSVQVDIVLPVINAPSNLHQPATDVTINVEALAITTTATVLNPDLNQDISIPVVPVASNVFNPTAGEDITIVDTDVIDAVSTVLSPNVTTSNVVTCQTLVTTSNVSNPELSYVIQADVVVTTSTIHEPSAEYLVTVPLISTSPTVNSPSIGDPPPPSEATGAIVKTNNPSPFPIGI